MRLVISDNYLSCQMRMDHHRSMLWFWHLRVSWHCRYVTTFRPSRNTSTSPYVFSDCLLAPPRQWGCVIESVCLFVCLCVSQNNSGNCGQILMKVFTFIVYEMQRNWFIMSLTLSGECINCILMEFDFFLVLCGEHLGVAYDKYNVSILDCLWWRHMPLWINT